MQDSVIFLIQSPAQFLQTCILSQDRFVLLHYLSIFLFQSHESLFYLHEFGLKNLILEIESIILFQGVGIVQVEGIALVLHFGILLLEVYVLLFQIIILNQPCLSFLLTLFPLLLYIPGCIQQHDLPLLSLPYLVLQLLIIDPQPLLLVVVGLFGCCQFGLQQVNM